MILFLTSSPCDNDVPEHMHLPCCFFEKNQFVDNLKKFWKQDSNCLIIAADPYQFEMNHEMAYTFHRAFLYHGMIPNEVRILDTRNDYHAKDLVEWSDMIILAGGHVPTQMSFFEKIGLRELLKDYDSIVMGISAGSMNSAKTVYCQPELDGESLDPNFVRFFPGLSLTEYCILPHYQNVKDHMLDGKRLFEDITYMDSYGQKLYALVDGSYILQAEDKPELYGEAYLIADGQISQICQDGQILEL